MKKESIIASTLGIVAGIGVGLVIISMTGNRSPEALEAKKVDVEPVRPKAQVALSSFEITAPEQDISTTQSKITITGKGTKDSLLIIQLPSTSIVEKLKEDSFSIEVPIVLGENRINVTYYGKDASTEYIERQIKVYSLPE